MTDTYFRLMAVVEGKQDNYHKTEKDINGYNSHVQSRIAGSGDTNLAGASAGWRMVGCTEAVSARDNIGAPATGGPPIYWFGGAQVADDYADFWDNSWDAWGINGQAKNRNGEAYRDSGNDFDYYVWTGCRADGTASVNALGKTTCSAAGLWLSSRVLLAPQNRCGPVFAISPVFNMPANNAPTIKRTIPGQRATAGGAGVTVANPPATSPTPTGTP